MYTGSLPTLQPAHEKYTATQIHKHTAWHRYIIAPCTTYVCMLHVLNTHTLVQKSHVQHKTHAARLQIADVLRCTRTTTESIPTKYKPSLSLPAPILQPLTSWVEGVPVHCESFQIHDASVNLLKTTAKHWRTGQSIKYQLTTIRTAPFWDSHLHDKTQTLC